jgi:DNA-binding CsgD family transcriptional regulator
VFGESEKEVQSRSRAEEAAGSVDVAPIYAKFALAVEPPTCVERAATPAQLASLGEQTRAIDRARGRMRRADPDEALAIWKGLVDGEWSLVDHIDSDGKRYVFAKRNAPEVRPWSDLTPSERQVLAYAAEGQPHKVIAYELGMTVPTVSTRLRTAARKVGAASRIELVSAYRRASNQKP